MLRRRFLTLLGLAPVAAPAAIAAARPGVLGADVTARGVSLFPGMLREGDPLALRDFRYATFGDLRRVSGAVSPAMIREEVAREYAECERLGLFAEPPGDEPSYLDLYDLGQGTGDVDPPALLQTPSPAAGPEKAGIHHETRPCGGSRPEGAASLNASGAGEGGRETAQGYSAAAEAPLDSGSRSGGRNAGVGRDGAGASAEPTRNRGPLPSTRHTAFYGPHGREPVVETRP